MNSKMQNFDTIKEMIKEMLDRERFEHTMKVEKEAVRLAKHWGADQQKAAVAGLLHDASRYMTPAQMLAEAEESGIRIDELERQQPKLLHARLSRMIAETKFGINDTEVLHAIECHTLGVPKMSLLDKIVYIADHIEPGRSHKGVDGIRKLAYEEIDEAVLASTTNMIKALIEKGQAVHPDGMRTRNYYLLHAHNKKFGA
jgi:predicted HD superfamily hydrolase involved in NAD metabolism